MKGLRLRGTKAYLLWALIAAELLMSFSFFGYLHIEPISITIAYVPVLLAGCLRPLHFTSARAMRFFRP